MRGLAVKKKKANGVSTMLFYCKHRFGRVSRTIVLSNLMRL